MRRLVVPRALLSAGEAVLPEDLAHYVTKVLRLSVQTRLRLLDGEGGVAEATLVRAERRHAVVRIEAPARVPRPAPEIELVQAVGKGDKMDAVVRQATELGVSRIHPVLTARAVARQDKRLERWRTIAEDAVRVAGHPWRPEIQPVRPLDEALDSIEGGLRLVFALEGASPLAERLGAQGAADRIVLLVGPEGGLTEDEVAGARDRGFVPAHLGARTLRTETAGPAVVAIVAFWAGRLGGVDPT